VTFLSVRPVTFLSVIYTTVSLTDRKVINSHR
jgi:hypothetical protein